MKNNGTFSITKLNADPVYVGSKSKEISLAVTALAKILRIFNYLNICHDISPCL